MIALALSSELDLSRISLVGHLGYDLPLWFNMRPQRGSGDGQLQRGPRCEDIILTCVRWNVVSPLSDRQLEELMQERGVSVDHATIKRWGLKYSPQLEAAFHGRKRPVWRGWRWDETYIRVRGQWPYWSRAVDQASDSIDVLLTEQRDERAALRCLTKAIRRHHVPHTITLDGSRAHAAAMASDHAEHDTTMAIRQVRHLNTVVEQDHRAVKRIVRPTLGFKSMETAQRPVAGMEVMPMLKKGPMVTQEGMLGQTPAQQFYALAASCSFPEASLHHRSKFATHQEQFDSVVIDSVFWIALRPWSRRGICLPILCEVERTSRQSLGSMDTPIGRQYMITPRTWNSDGNGPIRTLSFPET
jgi:putative transposase